MSLHDRIKTCIKIDVSIFAARNKCPFDIDTSKYGDWPYLLIRPQELGQQLNGRSGPDAGSNPDWPTISSRKDNVHDYISIGSTPCDEDCAQVGTDNYNTRARDECMRFISLIRKSLGSEPQGAKLTVKAFPHDFGTYHEVVCYYDDENEEATNYAFKCESEAPSTWQ